MATREWRPRIVSEPRPFALLFVANRADGLDLIWDARPSPALVEHVATFLEHRLTLLNGDPLAWDVNYLYVVLRRSPRAQETATAVGSDTAVAEFGLGSPPASPEEWPVLESRVLLKQVTTVLRGTEERQPDKRPPSAPGGRG